MHMNVLKRKFITTEEAIRTKLQHKKPCADCPFARTAINGWLGGNTPEEFLTVAHFDGRIDCHSTTNQQCAGAAIYRANVCKQVIDPNILELEFNKEIVFATPTEFLNHHKQKLKHETAKQS